MANITYENLVLHNVASPISLSMYYGLGLPTNQSATPIFRDIFVCNLTSLVESVSAEYLCLPESPCTDIDLMGVDMGGEVRQSCLYASSSQSHVIPQSCITPE